MAKTRKKTSKPKKKVTRAKAKKRAVKPTRRVARARKPARKAVQKKRPARPAPARKRLPEAENAPAPADELFPGDAEGADGEDDGAAERREVFNHYDRDGSGTIERGEFARLLEALGAELTEEQLAAGLAEVDRNHSGRISWGEFSAWWEAR
jgi:EF-hand domain pair